MGLLGNVSNKKYYDSSKIYGNYTFVSLREIIDNFMIINVGEGKILSKANVSEVQFHGMRAIQELSYDVLKSIKSQEIEVPPSLKMILPHDYVNYCKLVRVDSQGVERPLYPTGKTSNPFSIAQNSDGTYDFDANADGVITDGSPDVEGNKTDDETSLNYNADSVTSSRFTTIDTMTSNTDYEDDNYLRYDNRGRRYGLDPQHAQDNGTFYIDEVRGFIHFGSNLAGEVVTLKYISDGLGTDSEMIVHKFAEEAVYKYIMYGLISGRTGIPEYIVQRYKKEKFAETRKAKIRLSNIIMEEFTQVLKGLSKPIK